MNSIKLAILFFTLSIFSSSLASAKIYSNHGPKYERIPRNALSKAAVKIGKPYHLKLICASLGTIAGEDRLDASHWGLLFTSPDKLTLEQAQAMLKDVTTQLLQKMYQDPSFANYSIEGRKEYPTWDTWKPLSNNDLSIRIDFWDENVNRPLYPYVAEIRFIKEKFYYYFSDPKTQALQDPILIEPFSDPIVKS